MVRTKDRKSEDDEEGYDKSLNLRLRDHVRRADLTLDQVASELGWNHKKVQRLLLGETRLLANHMVAFSRVLKKPIADLYGPVPKVTAGSAARRAA